MSQTIIIESNREIAYQEELDAQGQLAVINQGSKAFPNNKWRQKVENGIQVNAGDQISVEACMINTRGSPEETMEFSGTTNPNQFGLVDNEAVLSFQYYVTNKQQFNINLPLESTIVKNDGPAALEDDFGCINLASFDNFKKAYPYEKLETNAVSQNPPFPICRPSPIRMFLTNTEMDATKPLAYFGWEVPGGENEVQIYERDIPFKVTQGFNTPANVGETITQQFHNRLGEATNWTDELQTPTLFSLQGTTYVGRQNSLITDQSFLSVSNSTGDIFQKRLLGQWSSKLPGEAGGDPEGTGYTEAQGRGIFYHNMLCGNPDEWAAMSQTMAAYRRAPKFAQQFSNPPTQNEIDNTGIYTGDTTNNNAAGNPVGVFGNFPCFLDNMDQVTGPNYVMPTGTGTTSTQINNMECMTLEIDQLVVTNVIYNAANVAATASAFEKIEIPLRGLKPTDPPAKQARLFSILMPYGRADDELSLGINNAKIMLPKPSTYNLPANAPAGSEGIGSDGLPNSYQPESKDGKKCLAGLMNGDFDARHEFRVYSRFVTEIMDPFHPLYSLNFPTNSRFQLENPATGERMVPQLSIDMNVGIIPVFYKEPSPGGGFLHGVPFMAYVSMDKVRPTAGAGITQKILPYPVIGEFLGISPSINDNLLAKLGTTQKQQTGAPDAHTGHYAYPAATDPAAYMPYSMIGADNPTMKFDEFGRFSFSDLHTATRGGNGSFQAPLDTKNEQASITLMEINTSNTFFNGTNSDRTNAAPGTITQLPIPFATISSQSGIALTKVGIPEASQLPDREIIDLTAENPQAFEGTLFQKMGFRLEQLLPITGQRQIQFNRGNYNAFIGTDVQMSEKFNNMIKPFTTNAYISGADQLGIVLNDSLQNMENLGATATLAPVNTNAESDELTAIDLPTKLDYAYLVVYSDIVRNNIFYGGGNGRQKIPALAYIARNYSTGDYFYSFTTGWTYTADQDYVLTDFVTEIMLPNGRPAPIESNSSVIYKIQKPQALPPPPQQLIPTNDPKDVQKERATKDKR